MTRKGLSEDTTLKRGLFGILTGIVFVSILVTSSGSAVDAQTSSFQLSLRNLTTHQPITPAIIVVHDEDAVVLPSSAERLEGLEELAESGANAVLIESLKQRTGVKEVFRFGGITAPGSVQTLHRVEAATGDHVTVIGSLACTNDAIVVGTLQVSGGNEPAFGSGYVLDAGTEANDESRATVPCFDGGEGASELDTMDGEGIISPHPGIRGDADLGEPYGWGPTVMNIILDKRGGIPRGRFEVGFTISNETRAQPLTPPVVVVHDPNVDILDYTRPVELRGIGRLSEGGDGDELIATLSTTRGIVSAGYAGARAPIEPGRSYSNNVQAYVGTAITVVGMLACTNDGYIVATAQVAGSTIKVNETSGQAKVFDSGAENNDETSATVPCLGGDSAAFSDGPGENGRREHPGIEGSADLDAAQYAWIEGAVASVRIHSPVQVVDEPDPVPTVSPEPTQPPEEELPDTGGYVLPRVSLIGLALLGTLVMAGSVVTFAMTRRRSVS